LLPFISEQKASILPTDPNQIKASTTQLLAKYKKLKPSGETYI
jgi:hypothetical protein